MISKKKPLDFGCNTVNVIDIKFLKYHILFNILTSSILHYKITMSDTLR